MIKAHEGRVEASHEHQVRGRNVSTISLSQHQYQHIVVRSSSESAETIRIPLLVCIYWKHPQGGRNIIHIELEWGQGSEQPACVCVFFFSRSSCVYECVSIVSDSTHTEYLSCRSAVLSTPTVSIKLGEVHDVHLGFLSGPFSRCRGFSLVLKRPPRFMASLQSPLLPIWDVSISLSLFFFALLRVKHLT